MRAAASSTCSLGVYIMQSSTRFQLVFISFILLNPFPLKLCPVLHSASKPPGELLWPDGAPGAVGSEDADKPSVTVYLPPSNEASGMGVVVCAGGGSGFLAVDHEGDQIARWLNSQGIAAFVLRYRIAARYRHPAPMLDAQRAIRWVRFNAERFRVARDRIGIWGFSAGGHLASTVFTHFDSGSPNAPDPIDRLSCRPDFVILAYPVISFTAEYTHRGSRDNLLGKDPDPKLVELVSNEKEVTRETPPTFLFHTDEDDGVPAELHIYQRREPRPPPTRCSPLGPTASPTGCTCCIANADRNRDGGGFGAAFRAEN